MQHANRETIQRIYEAFARGDIDVVLDSLADDVSWGNISSHTPPWDAVWNGKPAVAEFLRRVLAALVIERFTPLRIDSGDHDAFASVECVLLVRGKGHKVESTLQHFFRFDDEGKITFLRATDDFGSVGR